MTIIRFCYYSMPVCFPQVKQNAPGPESAAPAAASADPDDSNDPGPSD